MNENLVKASPVQPLSDQSEGTAPALWNPAAAGAWSLIFNPIFGSILVLMNWQALKVPEKIRSAQLWLVLSIIVLVVVLFLPRPYTTLVNLSYLLVWYLSVANPQAKYIKERWGNTYPRRSWLWPLSIAFGLVLSILCLVFVLVTAQEFLSQ